MQSDVVTDSGPQVSFYIQTHPDAIEEGDEMLSVVLSDAVNIAIGTNPGTVTIVDTPTISVGDTVIQEGQGADVDVSLSHVCSRPVTAQWTNPPGSVRQLRHHVGTVSRAFSASTPPPPPYYWSTYCLRAVVPVLPMLIVNGACDPML